MNQTIKIKRRATSTVPDDILINHRLSWAARVVLGWMLGRSPDFVLHVWQVRKTFRLSEAQWSRIRREMEQEGHYKQERLHDPATGKFTWWNIVSDQPEFQPSPQNPWDGSPWNGSPSHGDRGDIPVVSKTNESKTTTTAPQAQRGGVFELGELDIEPVIAPFLPQLLGSLQDAGIADPGQGQDLLDELAGAMEAGKRDERAKVADPVIWLQAVIAKGFRRARCIEIQARRQASREAALRRQSVATHSIPVDQLQVAKAKGDELIANVRRRRQAQET